MLTKEQKLERAKTLGASEIPAVLGIDPFRGPFTIWHNKLFPDTDDTQTPQQSRGHFAEPMLAAMYERDKGLRPVPCQKTFTHPVHPWLTCTPDYLVPGGRALECKTTVLPLNPSVCPPVYEMQARGQMAVLPELIAVDVAAMDGFAFMDGVPIYYAIPRDEELWRQIFATLEKFWLKNVLERIEPDPDDTLVYARWRDKQPSQGLTMTIPDVPENEDQLDLLNTITRYRDISHTIDHLKASKSIALNVLRLKLEKYDVVRGSFGAFHYKKFADSEQIHWENVARYIGAAHKVPQEDFDQLVRIHTQITPGGRHPMPRWRKDKK